MEDADVDGVVRHELHLEGRAAVRGDAEVEHVLVALRDVAVRCEQDGPVALLAEEEERPLSRAFTNRSSSSARTKDTCPLTEMSPGKSHPISSGSPAAKRVSAQQENTVARVRFMSLRTATPPANDRRPATAFRLAVFKNTGGVSNYNP